MKNTILRIGAFVLLSLISNHLVYSQGCVNADFSNNDFTNWTGRTGSCCPINMGGNGIVNGRHTIMTGAGTDPNACDDITVVAPGYTYSARLGNPAVGAQGERLSYTYNVQAGSELFTYQYAVVLQDPGHSAADQPRFEIRVLDGNGQLISQQCGYYQVTAAANIPGFRTCGGSVRYRAWTPVGIDLSAYIGQNVTIEFTTGDCDLGGHYGYAYIVGECNPLEIQVDYCPSNSNVATLTAPAGFTYQWNTGATSRSISIADPPNGSQYSCTLTAVTGCQVTLNATITSTAVNTLFDYPPPCPNAPIQFNDLTTSNIGSIVTWEWDFGDGTTSDQQHPTHTYASSGLYNVSLNAITGSGCQATYVETVDVNPVPQAGFAAPTVCDGTPATITNTTLFPNTIGSWEWDFGDNTPVNTTNWDATHTYDSAATYDVTLITRSHNGACTDTATGQITIAPLPTAGYTFNDVCFGTPVDFTNTSQGNITNSVWDFDHNSPPGYEPEPQHDFPAPGDYDVELIATNVHGCSDTVVQTVTVNANPHSSFDFGNVCAGANISFTNSSVMPPNNNITDWVWDFGDGSNLDSTNWEPTHSFSPGNYYVTLVTHSPGRACSDTLGDSVRVFNPPVAAFDFQNVCLGQAMIFTNQSSGDITSWEWDFGDNSAVNYNPNIAHTYDSAITYEVELQVMTIYGCSDSVTQTVEVYPSPTASFEAEPVCEGEISNFTSSATIPPQSSIVRYQWNFADLTPTVDGQTVNHAYTNPGNFNVTHYVYSDEGCIDSIIQTVVVNPKPVVDFAGEPKEGCSPVCVDFRDLSGIMSGTNAEFYWLFGDGNFSPAQNPTHCYKNLSSDSLSANDVTLTVTSDKGCVSSLRKDQYVQVYPTPEAGFDYEPKITTLVFPTISFYDESVDATQWLWNFGDIQVNNTSEAQNPEYTYLDTGTYSITQVVYNDFGCTDSIDVTVIVNPDYTVYIPSAFTPDDNEVNDEFYVTGIGIQEFEIRIFDRWGSMVYFSKDINEGWDGEVRNQGRTSKQDVYVYTVKILDMLGEEHSYNGKVMLLR